MSAGIQAFVQLAPCIDSAGHRFTIPPTSSRAVCGRCGLIRAQPETFTNTTATDLVAVGKDHAKHTNWAPAPGDNTGHGHVWLRPDGVKARCGGPSLCADCATDLAKLVRDGGH